MIGRHARTALVIGVVTALTGATAAPAAVSDDDIERSISTVAAEGVTTLELEDSISELEQETQEGARTVVTLDANILFEFGSSAVAGAAKDRLAKLAARIPAGTRVAVIGHTDSIGSDAANLRLSRQRAETVAKLLRAGNARLVLAPSGRGEADPVASNGSGGEDDPQGRARNRRVVVEWTP